MIIHFEWKGINHKQSTRWQHLSRLKASAYLSLQRNCCYETQQLIHGTGTAIWWVTEPHYNLTILPFLMMCIKFLLRLRRKKVCNVFLISNFSKVQVAKLHYDPLSCGATTFSKSTLSIESF